jgi:hypothetical protein
MNAPLGYRQIFSFYWPLVLTSQMMTLAHPIINAALGRSEDAIVQLAGYGVGFGLGVFINSPLFPFQQLVAALGTGPRARRDLLVRGLLVAAGLTALELVIAATPVGTWLVGEVLGSTPAVTALARRTLLFMAPITLLLPLRSLAWGIVLRYRDTRLISQATALRLSMLTIVVFATAGRSWLPPAVAGGLAMTAAIFVEAAYSLLRAVRLVRRDAVGVNTDLDERVGWRAFFAFSGPVMVSTVAWSAMRPLLNAVVGRTADPDLAQGGLGFVFPLLILMASPLWAIQNTSLVLINDRHDLRKVARFTAAVVALFVVLIGGWVWTPLRGVLLTGIFSLEPDKAAYVVTAVMLIPFQPIPMGLRSLSQGFLMNRRSTGVIALASTVKTVLLAGLGFAAVAWDPQLNGTLLATVLVMLGGSVETVIIADRARRLHHELMDEADAAGNG